MFRLRGIFVQIERDICSDLVQRGYLFRPRGIFVQTEGDICSDRGGYYIRPRGIFAQTEGDICLDREGYLFRMRTHHTTELATLVLSTLSPFVTSLLAQKRCLF